MRIKDVKIGEVYRIRNNPFYFKPTKVLKPSQGLNKNTYTVVEGWFSSVDWNFNSAIKKHFRLTDLVSINKPNPTEPKTN